MGKIKNSKKIIGEILCLIFGIACALIGLYYYHFQYLCYYYTPLLIILAIVVCLGSALLSLCISVEKNKDKKEKYDLYIISNSQLSRTNQAEATIAIPFPDRENIRIDFNIFASEVEDEGYHSLYFHMESAF